EPASGSISRRLPPFHEGQSLNFVARNANKRGVVVDLDASQGRYQLLRLLETADIWLESTRPGELADRGLAVDSVLDLNPGLVVTSITDFGQTGPYRDWQGNETIHVAMSGILSRSGIVGREPLLPPAGISDDTSAVQAVWATLVAYWNRLRTG